jgi:hypothetical protein
MMKCGVRPASGRFPARARRSHSKSCKSSGSSSKSCQATSTRGGRGPSIEHRYIDLRPYVADDVTSGGSLTLVLCQFCDVTSGGSLTLVLCQFCDVTSGGSLTLVLCQFCDVTSPHHGTRYRGGMAICTVPSWYTCTMVPLGSIPWLTCPDAHAGRRERVGRRTFW